MCYELFENNGVLKREEISDEIKMLNKDDRKVLRSFGVKIGRYHVFQPRMIRPNAVKLKSIFWNCYYKIENSEYPNFGLNFVKNFQNKNAKYLLICGYETFKHIIVRIDMLEKLFLMIMDKKKGDNFFLENTALNLLGCSKEDFIIFMKEIGYKFITKNGTEFFKYLPKKTNVKKTKIKRENPFHILKTLEL